MILYMIMAMGKKRMCGSADVATGKMWMCAADTECGCVGKSGCADAAFPLRKFFKVTDAQSLKFVRQRENCESQ